MSDVLDFMYKTTKPGKAGKKTNEQGKTTKAGRVKTGCKKTVFNWFVNKFRKKLVVK